MINDFLVKLLNGHTSRALEDLEKKSPNDCMDEIKTMLRLAIFQLENSLLHYQKIYNLWKNLDSPSLKPNPARRKVFLLADFTADNLIPLISIFCEAQGVQVEITLAPFDSLEQTILDPSSNLYSSKPDMVVWIISERWLQQFTGNQTLTAYQDIERAQKTLDNFTSIIKSHISAELLVTNIPGSGFSLPSGTLSYKNMMGWNLAVSSFNLWLTQNHTDKLRVVDLAGAIFREGGRQAMGTFNYLRARMAYEPQGTVAVCREVASAISNLSGKTHRALVFDWDNTIWGGEVAELGSVNVMCGHDSSDALGYRMVQENIKALKPQGTLLAGVSRNDPQVIKIFQENNELVLKEDDFASIQLGFHPKSQSISKISNELGFGPEFMVFMDDNIFEIAQVLTIHPYIDVILAGPTPEQTLSRLASNIYFNAVSLSESDVQRNVRSIALKKQQKLKTQFDNIDDFLKEINIRLTISSLNDKNLERIVQMFQKSNQFNLTTRRHQESDLKKIDSQGGFVYAVSYEDSLGSQGIISVVNLMPDQDSLKIESWVMSCRVLNRTVEQAVFSFILEKAGNKSIQGEYIPTEKNKLVKNLFKDFGFNLLSRDPENGREFWEHPSKNADIKPVKHFTTIKER